MNRRRRWLHIVQFVGGIAMLPLAYWFYQNADFLGVVLALVVGLMVVGYTSMNLFVRPWP
jgi:uncharacterized membrane protein